MIPNVVAEAARRFGDRIAYVTERGWPLTYADVDQVSDEVAEETRVSVLEHIAHRPLERHPSCRRAIARPE